ncbi:MAG: GAF domain-containing sensor histidine kinase [Candidatus Paceibacterota bacterium]
MTKTVASKKLEDFNKTTLYAMAEESNISIVKKFTDQCIDIFEADFGFAWGKFNDADQYRLVYKSLNTPGVPTLPDRKKTKKKTVGGKLWFDSNVKKENYESIFWRLLKSYIIIPIHYGDRVYGEIILCYKQKHDFSAGEIVFSNTAGNTIAQAITINWMNENEQKALVLAEKQKTVEVLLSQEKLKNDFIANATHEIRTPLAIIKGNIDLVRRIKNSDTKFNKEILVSVDEEVNRLSDIVSDLALLTSQGGRGQTDAIIYHKIDLKSLIKSVVNRCATLASPKNISIFIKNIPSIKIPGNEDYLEKMFMNLIKNSITYGHQNGRTTVSAKVSKGFVKISVEDNGVGVSKEDIKHVFERFYRGDKSHNSDGNRTGLGLAIVKWVAETHKGSVELKSTKSKGSIFSVTLPIKVI